MVYLDIYVLNTGLLDPVRGATSYIDTDKTVFRVIVSPSLQYAILKLNAGVNFTSETSDPNVLYRDVRVRNSFGVTLEQLDSCARSCGCIAFQAQIPDNRSAEAI